MKKIFLVGLVSVLLSLTSCQGNGVSHDEKGNVVVTMSLMNSPNENPGWLAAIEAANELLEEDKIRIEPEIIMTDEWDKYYTKIASNMAGGVGGSIGRIAESHIPLMIKRNQLQDLTSIYEGLPKDDYILGAFEGVAKNNNKYFAMPTGIQHMVLYYNKNILDAKNVSYPSQDWHNPITLNQLAEKALALSSGSRPSRKFGLSAGPFLAYGGMYAKSFGSDYIFTNSGQSALNQQGYYDTYSWFNKIILQDQSAPKASDTAIVTAMDQFQSGNVAMIIDGAWWLNDMMNPKLVTFPVGIAAIPTGIQGSSSFSTQFTDGFFAVRNSSTPNEDKKAIKALMSKEAIMALASKGVGGIPVHKEAIEIFKETLTSNFSEGDVNCFINGLSNGLPLPYTTFYNSVDQNINQKMSVWLNGDMTSNAFVDFMHLTLSEAIENN
ncbi:MAG: extracellular solute-binding protein [Bacillales bacterium]|jgi:ABC-type glycerol-3-phosphate transport system substrate-binding protein|nr:extracellular solute-binding protein [Bacillales bacterium]